MKLILCVPGIQQDILCQKLLSNMLTTHDISVKRILLQSRMIKLRGNLSILT